MSLVNLSHVCSHLQNASLARLGLTSIPYTRLHLSLSLLLQNQGFLSQVKLAGPSPPASCFPPGLRDNMSISSHPHSDRSLLTPETALQRMVAEGRGVKELRKEGFDEEAVEFAVRGRQKSERTLESEGWDDVAVDFMLQHKAKTRDQMEAEGFDTEAIDIVEKHRPMIDSCRAEVRSYVDRVRTYFDERQLEKHESEAAERSLLGAIPDDTQIDRLIRAQVKRTGFDKATLQYFAGDQRYVTERDLARDGVELEAMGQTIPSQPFSPLPKAYADPWDLETEGVVTQSNRASRRLWLGLKYYNSLPVLSKARMISKPTKRLYLTAKELGNIVRGNQVGEVRPLGQVGEVMAVSTDLGVLEARECVERMVGGMPLCRIW